MQIINVRQMDEGDLGVSGLLPALPLSADRENAWKSDGGVRSRPVQSQGTKPDHVRG